MSFITDYFYPNGEKQEVQNPPPIEVIEIPDEDSSSDETSKKRKLEPVIKEMKTAWSHYTIPYKSITLSEHEFFDILKTCFTIIIAAALDINKHGIKHFHIIGTLNFNCKPRQLRDKSKIAGVKLHPDVREALLNKPKEDFIGTIKYFDNAWDYIALKDNHMVPMTKELREKYRSELPEEYSSKKSKLTLEELDEKLKQGLRTDAELNEFRSKYPTSQDWRKYIQLNPGVSQELTKEFETLELQYRNMIFNKPPSDMDRQIVSKGTWLYWLTSFLWIQMDNLYKDNNIGVAMILQGKADTCKSTISRILGLVNGPCLKWTGSQFIKDDLLKWDSALRQGSQTIVIEEMVWQDINKKITIENTLNLLKEQLTGSGANLRMSKAGGGGKSDSPESQIKYFIVSMNDDAHKTAETIRGVVKGKEELLKRIIVVDMDSISKMIQSQVAINKDEWMPANELSFARCIKQDSKDEKFKQSVFDMTTKFASTFPMPQMIIKNIKTIIEKNKEKQYFDLFEDFIY